MARRNRRRITPQKKRERRSNRIHAWVFGPLRLFGLAVLGAGIGFGAYQVMSFLRTSPALAVRSIEIKGTVKTATGDLLRAAELSEGINIFSVDVEEIRRKVEKLPWIRSAQVQRIIPDTVIVEAQEHIPAALIALTGLYYVSERGEVFKRVQPGEDVDFPVLTGISRKSFHSQPLRSRKYIYDSLKLVEKLKTIPCLRGRKVAEVNIDELMGSTLILDPGALTVRLNNSDELKGLNDLCRTFSELESRNLRPHTILLDRSARGVKATVRIEKENTLATSNANNPLAGK
ncbi:MAG: FtsQ-type POTRA domain-containing protein [Deltaproteobacteria bacterium]|nr:FtsQ-type POTRA domain-containing protein [Deltaproteobacteria bacterium]